MKEEPSIAVFGWGTTGTLYCASVRSSVRPEGRPAFGGSGRLGPPVGKCFTAPWITPAALPASQAGSPNRFGLVATPTLCASRSPAFWREGRMERDCTTPSSAGADQDPPTTGGRAEQRLTPSVRGCGCLGSVGHDGTYLGRNRIPLSSIPLDGRRRTGSDSSTRELLGFPGGGLPPGGSASGLCSIARPHFCGPPPRRGG